MTKYSKSEYLFQIKFYIYINFPSGSDRRAFLPANMGRLFNPVGKISLREGNINSPGIYTHIKDSGYNLGA